MTRVTATLRTGLTILLAALALIVAPPALASPKPRPVTKDAERMMSLLEGAHWVPAGAASGPVVYFVAFPTCPYCLEFEHHELPRLKAAGVDVRIILFAREDFNGISHSTPVERATVAELWLKRDPVLMQRWLATRPVAWQAEGVPPVEGHPERLTAIKISRQLVYDVMDIAEDNGEEAAVPLLVWRTVQGQVRLCACDRLGSLKGLKRDLGLP